MKLVKFENVKQMLREFEKLNTTYNANNKINVAYYLYFQQIQHIVTEKHNIYSGFLLFIIIM